MLECTVLESPLCVNDWISEFIPAGLQILFTTEYCVTRESHYVVILLKVALDIGKCHVQPRALT